MPFFALSQAIESAGGKHLTHDDGIILATTTGQISVWERELIRFMKKEICSKEFEKVFRHQPLGSLLEALIELFSFAGKALLVSSACTASTQAIALGSQWINRGIVKRCFVGGTEILCDLTIEGFKSLQLLSSETASPFDVNRTGINLSEGAAFLCLEGVRSPQAIASILGSGLSSDSYHMTAPHPEGHGSLMAMKAALQSAGLDPSDISWVHAHGTGSKHNDLAESCAIKTLFGETAPWVSSTKWVHGHALGASGTLETILCTEALREKTILATGGLKNPDPQISVKHPPHHVPFDAAAERSFHILKNTLGFGGINASLVISDATGTQAV
jgi:3-oxoacyl-[acyl-carrier-protein] synthase-1